MVEFHRLKIIQIKESRWIIAISSNGSLYYTIRACTYIMHMLVKTSEISARRAFIIPFLFDLQHISLKISASVLMIWDQTEDTGLSFRKNTAFCLAQNGTKNRPAKTQNCLKVGIVQEFCLPALPLDCYKGGVLWCFEMNDPKYNMRSSYKKHRNDLKWSQNIAKNQPSKSWRLRLSCCILIHQPPEKPLGICQTHRVDPSSLNGKAPESYSWIQIHHHWRVGLAYRRKNIQGKAKGSRGSIVFHNQWWFPWKLSIFF